MKEIYKKDLDDVILEFCFNGMPTHDTDWVDVDIKITSPVISFNLKDWERDGEIFMRKDITYVIQLMNRWLENKLTAVEEYESVEPDLLLRFYPGEKRIDFCICLQTKDLAFTENYIILPLFDEDATDFVEYWKRRALEL